MKMTDIMAAQKEEMLRHKWIESEKAGHDLGDSVMVQWTREHGAGWRYNFNLEHLMELPEGDHAVYFGIFLDDESRKTLADTMSIFVPDGWEFRCERCTLAFGNPDDHPEVKKYIAANLGKKVTMRVDSVGRTDDVFAAGVTGDFVSAIEVPHVPVATPPGGHAKNSNLIRDWKEYFPKIQLTGTVDTFPRIFP
jgi:hypothetical protein